MHKLLISAIFTSVLLLSACSRQEAGNPVPGEEGNMATDSAGNPMVLDVDSLAINQLSQHPDPVISNNVRVIIESLKKYDYAEAMISLTQVASMGSVLSPGEFRVVTETLEKVTEITEANADAGNENAKYAMEILTTFAEQK